jgi:drug/metabolite transporter (DMT)-like permease
MKKTTSLYLVLAVTILIWGNSFVFVDMAIRDGSSPVMIAMARFVVASSIFLAYMLIKKPSVPDKQDRRLFHFLAFIGIGVYYIFQYYGVKFAGPSVSAILVTMMCPIVIFLLSVRRLGERVTSTQKLGLGISATGSFFVITDGTLSFISNSEAIVGGVFGIICAIFWAVYTVEGKRVVKKYDPVASTAYITLMGTLMLVPFAAADTQLTGPAEYPLSFFVCALYLGVLCTVFGYVFWFRALTGLDASTTGAALYFEPLVTIVFAWMLLGETIGWVAGFGGALTMVGVVLVSRK